MGKPPPFDDAAKTHRWFGVELNNLAWDLLESRNLSEEDTQRMIHAAHASCWHWLEAGNSLHQQRGECLLTMVYLAAGQPAEALLHATRCLELSVKNEVMGEWIENTDAPGAKHEHGHGHSHAHDHDRVQSFFDRAAAFAGAACAMEAAGGAAKAGELRAMAEEWTKAFDDASEVEVFKRVFGRGAS